MRKQLYLDIKNLLKEIKNDDGNALFLHFDLWNQNVEFIEEETPFECPALFIEFAPIEWQQLGNKVQQAEITIKFHIVTRLYAHTADYSPTEAEALSYLDIPDKVLRALQGWAASCSNGFMRINSIPNHNHETIIDSVEEYKTLITDRSADRSINLTAVEDTNLVITNNPEEE